MNLLAGWSPQDIIALLVALTSLVTQLRLWSTRPNKSQVKTLVKNQTPIEVSKQIGALQDKLVRVDGAQTTST